VRCGKGTFVLRVKGQSIKTRFHDGEYFFVDPGVAADNGKFVVVGLEDPQEATFKQLIVEGGRMYLRALNPDWPTRIWRSQRTPSSAVSWYSRERSFSVKCSDPGNYNCPLTNNAIRCLPQKAPVWYGLPNPR